MMSKKRILLIDDEKTFTRVLKLNLEKSGPYEVREENKGTNAFASAREFKPDLILLDIMMPDIDGDEVAAQLKADRHLGTIPIVFLTAVASKEEVKNLQGFSGGHSFLAKPATIDEVTHCIEGHLGVSKKPSGVLEMADKPEPPSQLHRVKPQGPFPRNSQSNVTRDFIISILVILLATGGYVSYRLYRQSQRMIHDTLAELQKSQSHLSSVQASAAKLNKQQKINLAATKERLMHSKPLELVLPGDKKGTRTIKVSSFIRGSKSNFSLSEVTASVVKLHCRVNSQSRDVRRGSGILYRTGPNRPELGPYHIQTSLHVVDTTDGSDAQCSIFLYPDHTKGDIHLLFKSRSYRFYRKDIDIAFVVPETIKGDPHSGTLNDLAKIAQVKTKNPICDSTEIGDHLSVLGYPAAGGKTLTVTEGIISGFEFDGETRFIKSSAKLGHGNSGGVAIKDSGCLVGIPTFVQHGQLESIGRILDLNYLYKTILN